MDAVFPLCVCLDFFCILQSMPDKDLESEARKRVGNADVAEKSSTEATGAGRGFLAFGRYFQYAIGTCVHVMCM